MFGENRGGETFFPDQATGVISYTLLPFLSSKDCPRRIGRPPVVNSARPPP